MSIKLDFRVRRSLEKHIQKRADNRSWVYQCLQGDPAAFPHRVREGGLAKIGDHFFVPHPQLDSEISPCDNDKPRYVVNIPMAHVPGAEDVAPFRRLVTLILNEAFGVTAAASRAEVRQRVVVVIGINQIHSVEPKLNRQFEAFIGALPRIDGVVYRVFGFYWNPEWTSYRALAERTCRGIKLPQLLAAYSKSSGDRKTADQKILEKYEKCSARLATRVRDHFGVAWSVEKISDRELFGSIYGRDQAFLVMKAFSHPEMDVAAQVRKSVELEGTKLHSAIRGQIPFQEIRETIMKSKVTRRHVLRFQETAPASAGYLVMMDDDLIGLRKGEGIFTRMDQSIQTSCVRSALSHGYSVEDTEPPLLRAAIRVDMKVREALGCLAYLPEPLTGVLVRRPNEAHHLARLTFKGDGAALESRRIYQNGIQAGVLRKDALLVADGGVTMRPPARMKTKKVQSLPVMTAANVKEKRYLETIRGGISQSHVKSLKWAEIVYAGLDFSTPKVSDGRRALVHMFTVFDPINRMFATPGIMTATIFDMVIREYHNPLSDGLASLLAETRAELKRLKMEDEMIDQVEAAARRSGEAVWSELRVLTEEA